MEMNSENAGHNGPHDNLVFPSNITDFIYFQAK